MKSVAVTDLDRLVELGYDRRDSQRALQSTRGNVSEAKILLRKQNNEMRDVNAWRKDIKGDFEAGIDPLAGTLAQAENRALIKTPLYCSIGEHRVRDGVTFYEVNAICKTGVKVVRMRRYSSFSELKSRLPLGTCSAFSTTFPPAIPPLIGNVTSIFVGETTTETRRAALDDWLREFTTNEEIMTSMEPLKAMARQLLYTFLAIDQDTHSVLEESEDLWAKGSTVTPFAMTPGNSASETRISYGSSHGPVPSMRIKGPASKYIGQKGPLMFPTDSEKAMVSLINLSRIPSVDPQPFPLDVLMTKLPFKVAACEASQHMLLGTLVEDDRTVDTTSSTATQTPSSKGGIGGEGKDTSLEQLVKDMSRDRVIINGVRVSGCDVTIEQIVAIVQDEINAVLQANGKPPLKNDSEANCRFGEHILKSVSRTESAYLSHLTFSKIVEQREDKPLTIVPVSDLAEPLRMVVSLRIRDATASMRAGSLKEDFAVQVDLQAGTVFRVNDPLSDDLDTLCQVKCYYRRTIFGLASERGDSGERSCELTPKSGKAWVHFAKTMQTTREDWGSGGGMVR